jgi:hypothetical protein
MGATSESTSDSTAYLGVVSYFVVVGHACVVGLMDGEAIESLEDGDLKTRTLEIH